MASPPLLLLQIPNPLRLSFLPTSRSLPPHSSSRFLPRFRLRSPVISASTSADSSRFEDSFTKYSGYLFDGEAAAEIAKLDSYDPSKIEEIYRRRPFLVLRRLMQIFGGFGRWFSLRYFDRVLGRSEEMFKVRAGQFRMLLVELGPAFVKIAQAVSSRPDITPPSYLDELSLLQDQIAPFSSEIAFQTIEKELGLPIDTIFSEISLQPVAAASIGQVYQARLQLNREIVAVKVQRPGVQAAISLDMYILRFLAAVLRRIAKFNTDLPVMLPYNRML